MGAHHKIIVRRRRVMIHFRGNWVEAAPEPWKRWIGRGLRRRFQFVLESLRSGNAGTHPV